MKYDKTSSCVEKNVYTNLIIRNIFTSIPVIFLYLLLPIIIYDINVFFHPFIHINHHPVHPFLPDIRIIRINDLFLIQKALCFILTCFPLTPMSVPY